MKTHFQLAPFLMRFHSCCVPLLCPLILATKKLMCAHSLFRLTTIASVCLLFNPYPFLLLSSSVMSYNCGKSSLFSAINRASSAYLMLLTLCPPILISGYPSMLLKSFHCQERKGLGKNTSLSDTTIYFLFCFNELIYPSTHIVAV